MKQLRLFAFLVIAVVVLFGSVRLQRANGQDATLRDRAVVQMKAGNLKDAYAAFSASALDPQSDPNKVEQDLINGVKCLTRLGRVDEIDTFREKAIAAHAAHWRLLFAAARSYFNGDHHGFMIGGAFKRGNHRGGGKYMNATERDRVRALQLMQQAAGLLAGTANNQDYGEFYWQLSAMVYGYGGESWQLQELTDLSTLPDYEEGYGSYGYWGPRWGGESDNYYFDDTVSSRGAPVQGDGTPVFYPLPASWAAARNDGERWRWALQQSMLADSNRTSQVQYTFASFLLGQFGVHTMAGSAYPQMTDDNDIRRDESGPYALVTLKENETIARLANGIKRFTMPDDFNYIKIFQQVVKSKGEYGNQALSALGRIFADRRQYDRAAEYYARAGDQEMVKQILGNWCQFERASTQPAGKSASVPFHFRNGKKVSFSARVIDIPALLHDIKDYISANPKQLDEQRIDINNIGYHLVNNHQEKYLGTTAAAWEVDLQPRDGHFDRRITITTPLRDAGAYLLTAKMADGNESRVVIWVADAVIVKKPLENQTLYYLADAATGKPLPGARLDLFGYTQEWSGKRFNVTTAAASVSTDDNGLALASRKEQGENYSWIVTATANDHLAYLGFTNVWFNSEYDQQYNATRVFAITDRPVYRPQQTVKFKFWVNKAQYDREGQSPYAGQQFTVRVTDPKRKKVLVKALTADQYGGFQGEFPLAQDATLGLYQIALSGAPYGGSSFRVEEYKKPEFEVTVDAPTDPVMLGDTVTATVKANYYFGAPVTNAKVHFKVLRTAFSGNWYPQDRWDWFYGRGYWWYAADYAWYPGWREWGCARPIPVWWGYEPQQPPELVLDEEANIGADGTLPIQIDTSLAKAMQADTDHRYEITAEVTDASRRVIVGQGTVLVARKPFKVYAWVNRGHYRVGDTVQADFSAQTLDNKPVQGKGKLTLLSISYQKDAAGGEMKPVERAVNQWDLDPGTNGTAQYKIHAASAGQFRLKYLVTDNFGRQIEGGYVFVVRGEGFNGDGYRFNDLELLTDKRDYQPGDNVNLMVNTNRENSTVLLFARPSNGIYLAPQVLHLQGKSAVQAIAVAKKDMPNFFIEALTVSDGKIYSEMREVSVPPEQRILNVEVLPSAEKYQPGQKAAVKIKVTDQQGHPYVGSLVASMYDKSVEYISGGSNVPDIKEFFWKWQRSHYPRTESSLQKPGEPIYKENETTMQSLGAFGASLADEEESAGNTWMASNGMHMMARKSVAMYSPIAAPASAGMAVSFGGTAAASSQDGVAGIPPMVAHAPMQAAYAKEIPDGGSNDTGAVEPTVRTNFADTAFWAGALQTDANGEASVQLTMPESLTTWKTRVWAMGNGTRVGEGEAEVVTSKNLIIRLQAPRFFMQKDEVVLSANVHNYLSSAKKVSVALELDGACLAPIDAATNTIQTPDANGNYKVTRDISLDANSETRIDWRVKVAQPGQATVRMKALSDEESDATQQQFPVYIHGIMKMDSLSGVLRPEQNQAVIPYRVPEARLPALSRLEVRYSPTLAGAMVDALPYLVAYPYNTSDVELDRFLPTVLTQNILLRMGLNLRDIRDKQTNLNAQEIGDDKTRAKDWQRIKLMGEEECNPVFDQEEVSRMVKAGVTHLADVQCDDGGWGWFGGTGQQSYPHTTALLVHGLQLARANKEPLPSEMLQRGVAWLRQYQSNELAKLQLWDQTKRDGKPRADALDAFVYLVLVDEKLDNAAMRDYLYRDRNHLPVYSKCMFALALNTVGDTEKRDMLRQNIEQYLVQDEENQTAYLKLPQDNWWWAWYGSEYETQAYYLKLLTAVDPHGATASRLVKYLLNNRKHASYWNSTRDTAIVIEAMAGYMQASGEDKPDMTVSILQDGQKVKDVRITAANLFGFDNQFVLEGDAVATGDHTFTLQKTGTGPLYFNAYLSYFTLEDPITRTGLEIKVNRQFFLLTPVQASTKVEGTHGAALEQRVEKYQRTPLATLDTVKSGDLIEVELTIDSKNDYEYILFEDMKAAGCEPVEVRSGYNNNEMGAYMELHDERVAFLVRSLARGAHSLSYRLRAETPGQFSAMPTKASAMYAPELKANSDEMKLPIEDK